VVDASASIGAQLVSETRVRQDAPGACRGVVLDENSARQHASEPSSTLMFWSSTMWRIPAPLSRASIAVIRTASLVRTISRIPISDGARGTVPRGSGKAAHLLPEDLSHKVLSPSLKRFYPHASSQPEHFRAVIIPFESQPSASIDRLVDLVTADLGRVNAVILSRTGPMSR